MFDNSCKNFEIIKFSSILISKTKVYISVTTDMLSIDKCYKRRVNLSRRVVEPGGGLEIPCSYHLFGPREKKGLLCSVIQW